VLGRGIKDILGDINSSDETVLEIEIDKILPNPFQPRKVFDDSSIEELGMSIKEHGLLQPILVTKSTDGYILIAGERRLRASKVIGNLLIKAIVLDVDISKMRELALIENIQREDLNLIDLAISYKELIEEHRVTHDELSKIVKKSRTQITNTLRLLSLSQETKDLISDGKLSFGHAKVIVGLSSDEEKRIVDKIVSKDLSVRETEDIIKNIRVSTPIDMVRRLVDYEELNLDTITPLLNNFKTKITKNRLTIEFRNSNDVENFIKLLSK